MKSTKTTAMREAVHTTTVAEAVATPVSATPKSIILQLSLTDVLNWEDLLPYVGPLCSKGAIPDPFTGAHLNQIARFLTDDYCSAFGLIRPDGTINPDYLNDGLIVDILSDPDASMAISSRIVLDRERAIMRIEELIKSVRLTNKMLQLHDNR